MSDDPPPYIIFWPYHTFERNAAMPLVPSEVAKIAFEMLPLLVRLTVERNCQYASNIDLLIIFG